MKHLTILSIIVLSFVMYSCDQEEENALVESDKLKVILNESDIILNESEQKKLNQIYEVITKYDGRFNDQAITEESVEYLLSTDISALEQELRQIQAEREYSNMVSVLSEEYSQKLDTVKTESEFELLYEEYDNQIKILQKEYLNQNLISPNKK